MISGSTRVAAVIGHPVAHSRSPAMLNAAFAHAAIDAVMIPMAVAPTALPAALAGLRAMHALGASVTLPHKLAAHALCDELADSAREVAAVNCIHVDGERLVGHNTDAPGFVDGLRAAGIEPTGLRVVLLGAGGAARAVAYGLRDCERIVVARGPVAWAPDARAWTPGVLRDCFASAELVVDCTPIGLDDAVAHDLPLDALPASAVVASLIYHRETALLVDAAARGHRTVDGRAMLVHQGARAFTIWTGQPAPIAVMDAALGATLGE